MNMTIEEKLISGTYNFTAKKSFKLTDMKGVYQPENASWCKKIKWKKGDSYVVNIYLNNDMPQVYAIPSEAKAYVVMTCKKKEDKQVSLLITEDVNILHEYFEISPVFTSLPEQILLKDIPLRDFSQEQIQSQYKEQLTYYVKTIISNTLVETEVKSRAHQHRIFVNANGGVKVVMNFEITLDYNNIYDTQSMFERAGHLKSEIAQFLADQTFTEDFDLLMSVNPSKSSGTTAVMNLFVTARTKDIT